MIDFDQLYKLTTPDGQREFVELVQECRKDAGKNWLADLKEYFPTFYEIADLIVNYSADDAFEIVRRKHPTAKMFEGKLKAIHQTLKLELERKRF